MISPRFAATVTALIALAGCSAGTAPPQAVPPPETADCGAGQLGGYVGQKATDDVIATLRQWRGDKPVRVLRPGSAMTMDYRPERLNVFLDDRDFIREFKCN